jgi:hypothetical protein
MILRKRWEVSLRKAKAFTRLHLEGLLLFFIVALSGCSTHNSVPANLQLQRFDPNLAYSEHYHLEKPEGMSLRSLTRQPSSVTYRYGLGHNELEQAQEVVLLVKKPASLTGARSFTELFDEGCQLYQHRQEAIEGLLNTVEVMACEPKRGSPGMVVANKSIRGSKHWFVATYYIAFASDSSVSSLDFESLPMTPDQRFHLHQFLNKTRLNVTLDASSKVTK